MSRPVPFGAAFVSAALLVAACAGSGGAVSAGESIAGSAGTSSAGGSSANGGGSSSTGGGSGTSTGGGSGTSTGGGGGGGNGGGGGSDAGFQYTPWGPDDPPIPEQYAAFATASTQDLNCDGFSGVTGQAFWDVAAAVCKALKNNQGWPDTTSVPETPPGDNAYQGCLNAELAAMLTRALEWHAANPGRRPVIGYPRRSSTSPCQSRVYEVKLVQTEPEDPTPLAVSVTAPTGKNGADFFVTVDGQPSDQGDVQFRNDVGDGLNRAVIFLNPPAQDQDALVVVDNGRGKMTTHVHLPAGSSSGNSSGNSSSSSGNSSGSSSGNSSGSSSDSSVGPSDSSGDVTPSP